MPAEIVDIMASPNYQTDYYKKLISPVSISLSDVKGKIIPAGDDIDFKVVVYYNPSSTSNVKKIVPLKLGLLTKSR